NPPIFEAIVFGIRLSIGTVGEQADKLEATARAAAYQDCHGHCKLPPEQHAALSASAAVTAVTGYSSSTPLFFGRPCNQAKISGASRICEDLLRAHQAATPPSLSAGPRQTRP